ncbi:hypothetical protein E2C01_064014 [Portunus trituberculatus]|uniref:Uncharacterized protein n=1 Tax=Portunus trituberculatus TaxID=210409 RepID=A0A5B7HHZ6_PORTR|nr:hypothetical protein [Portunus trituberculatus]
MPPFLPTPKATATHPDLSSRLLPSLFPPFTTALQRHPIQENVPMVAERIIRYLAYYRVLPDVLHNPAKPLKRRWETRGKLHPAHI